METLLLFFAFPVATIILSIVLLKILKCPILVAATFFAIYLILTYAVFRIWVFDIRNSVYHTFIYYGCTHKAYL